MSPSGPTFRLAFARHRALLCGALLAVLLPGNAGNADLPVWEPTTPPLEGTALAVLDDALRALPRQRPGVPDLYVLGVAGDASEQAFGNEVRYLQQMADQRWNAAGRHLGLINATIRTPDASPAPMATWESLGYALDALGEKLDPAEDILLLYMASHGLEDGAFYLQTAPGQEDFLTPDDLAQLLDEANIGNAVIVVSACYSGHFIPALASLQRMVITAARHDRPSFGCGNTDSATWFGRAFLIEALNQTHDFADAFELASATVEQRERAEGEDPSLPQLHTGQSVQSALRAWRATLPSCQSVPFTYLHQPAAPIPADVLPY